MRARRFWAMCLSFALGYPASGAASSLYTLGTRFVDDHGSPVELDRYRGRPAIVTMEYSNCRYICSATLARLKQLQALADRRGVTIDFLVLSLEPDKDTPSAWTQYRAERRLDRPTWHFLSARPEDVPRLAQTLGIRYWRVEGHLMHDFRLVRLNPVGEIDVVVDRLDADLGALLMPGSEAND